MNNIEQKIIRVEATCSKTLDQNVDETLLEMNKKGFRLTSMNTITAKNGGNPDIHGMSYGTNEKKELIFEKVK